MSHPITRGIDHVGVTVTDLDAATDFLDRALGAEVIYDSLPKGSEPQSGADVETRLGLAAGATVTAIRMLRLGYGAGLELFEIQAPDQHGAARGSDIGLQHIALYVDDMAAATERFTAAGGTVFAPPHPLPAVEGGDGNVFSYGRTPWGLIVEFVTYPSLQPYRETTPLMRYTPPSSP